MNKLVVVLTFDDGLDCHLDIVVPILERYGLLGTFFINLNSPSFLNRMQAWQEIARGGHELGNHTIFHPALSKYTYITEGRALENYTVDRMRIELETANLILTALDNRHERTFAYPSSNKILGRPGWAKKTLKLLRFDKTRVSGWLNDRPNMDIFSREKDYSCLMPGLFVAARAGDIGLRDKWVNEADRYFIPCVSADGLTAKQLNKKVASFKESGNVLVFMFHGIESGHDLVCKKADFVSLIEGLVKDKDIQILPFSQAAKLI